MTRRETDATVAFGWEIISSLSSEIHLFMTILQSNMTNLRSPYFIFLFANVICPIKDTTGILSERRGKIHTLH